MTTNPHFGSFLDDWLKEQGIYEEVTNRVSLDRIKQMKAKGRMKAIPADAPETETGEDFSRNATVTGTALLSDRRR
jgi:hypothetical protein